MAVDQFTDVGFRVLSQRIRQFPDIDPFIKEAVLDVEENEKIASSAFAWESRRLFRIDSPAQAALSRVYMEKQADVPRSVIAKCDKALELFGVDLPLNEKTAAARDTTDEYLLPHMKRFRVQSADDVKVASEAILRNHKRMDPETRAMASVNLAKMAVKYAEPIPSQILKFAGATMCDTRVLKDWLLARTEKTADAEISNAYEKLAYQVEKLPRHCVDREELIKVASVLRELDEAAGLEHLYDRQLLDPVTTVFNMDKVADEMMDLAGRQVPMDTLLSIEPAVYEDAFGPDLAGEFVTEDGQIIPEQLKIILPTVPRDLQQALAAQMGV